MEPDKYEFGTTPYEHQRDCFYKSCKAIYYALLLDLGTGKTKISIDTAAYMYENGWINAVMVFGNNGSYMNWVEGLEEHLPKRIPLEIGVWSSKGGTKLRKHMEEVIDSKKKSLKVLLMNIEAIAFERGFDTAYNFTKNHKTLAIVDESTTIGNPKAARTKAAWKIGSAAIARRILTGSCVDNSPLDAWAQYQFLKDGALGFRSYYAFRAQYAELKDMTIQRGGALRQFKTVVGFKNLLNLRSSIDKCSFIIKKEDCLDLPEKTFLNYYVELTEEQKTLYEQLKRRSVAELMHADGKSLVSTKLAITKMLRLHQLVCGHIKDDDGTFHEIKNNRLKALEEVLEEVSEKAIIWTSFTYDVKQIYEFIKEKYGADSVLTYYGETSEEERAKVKEVFKRGREDDKIRFVIANNKTGGYGNNFTAITTSIYYSYDFDNNVHHQTQDRIHRIGQTKPVTYVYLVAKGTIDEKIINVLKGKTELANMLTESNWKTCFE